MTTQSAPPGAKTRVRPAPAAPRHGPAVVATTTTATTWAAVRFTSRLVRRGALVLLLSVVAYLWLELVSYRATYPDPQSRMDLSMFADSPAVRMLQGIPHGVQTAAGFVAWDAGWFIQAVIAVWAILVTTRLLRGEEDDERAGILLAAPIHPRRLVAVQLSVLIAACLLVGGAAALVLGLSGDGWLGGALFGAGLAGFGATMVGVSAVAAQVLDTRRRAVSAASGVFAVSFLVRAMGNSADERGWLRWLTPFGWSDNVEAYGGQRVLPMIVLAVAAATLATLAVALRGRRDTGGAFITWADSGRPRLRGLGGPTAFAWRSGRGVLLSWVIGIAATAAVFGGMLQSMLDFLTKDDAYRELLARMGMLEMVTPKGFVGFLAAFFGVCLALYASWRLGAARIEEAQGRLDSVLARPVRRVPWLAGHALVTAVGTVLLALVTGLGLWLGAIASGADLAAGDALAAAANLLPVAAVFLGLSTVVFGLAPRLVPVLPASLAGLVYLLEYVGPGLDWPQWVLNLSPFHHVATVPAEAFAAVPAAVMVALGVVGVVLGLLAFRRRDVQGV